MSAIYFGEQNDEATPQEEVGAVASSSLLAVSWAGAGSLMKVKFVCEQCGKEQPECKCLLLTWGDEQRAIGNPPTMVAVPDIPVHEMYVASSTKPRIKITNPNDVPIEVVLDGGVKVFLGKGQSMEVGG